MATKTVATRVLGYLKDLFWALCLTWLQQSTAALETWYIRLQHGENKSSSTTRQSFRRFERVLTFVSSLIIRRREYITSRMKNAHVFPKPSGRSFKRRRTKSLYMDRTLLFSWIMWVPAIREVRDKRIFWILSCWKNNIVAIQSQFRSNLPYGKVWHCDQNENIISRLKK